jgi:hypothetical protein
MKDVANVIDEALGVIDPVEKKLSMATHKTIVPRPTENLEDIDADYKYQRENFYNLIERGTDAIDGILEIAKESDHPRTYEVAGNLIKQVAEVAEKLGDLQEKMKRLKEVPNTAPKNVTNALFVGSTAELQRLLKGKSNGGS